MSVTVLPEGLRERIDEYGERAYLITVGVAATTHVVSVVVGAEAGRLTMGAGRLTSENIAANPSVTLLWPPARGGEYSLIVDGEAVVVAGPEPVAAVTPTAAVLHRVAGASGDGPGCVPVI